MPDETQMEAKALLIRRRGFHIQRLQRCTGSFETKAFEFLLYNKFPLLLWYQTTPIPHISHN